MSNEADVGHIETDELNSSAEHIEENEDVFSFQMEKFGIFHALLQHINFSKKNIVAIVDVSMKTIRFVVGESCIWHASLSMGEDMFSFFRKCGTVRPFKSSLSIVSSTTYFYLMATSPFFSIIDLH